MPYANQRVVLNVAKRVRAQQLALSRYRNYRNLVRYKSPAFALASVGAGYLSTKSNGRILNNMRMSIRRARGITQRVFNRKSNFKRVQRSHIGERVGSDRTRSSNVAEDALTIDTRTLYVVPLIQNITEGTGNSQRFRDMLNIRGFKLRFEITNEGGEGLIWNVAVIHPKQGSDVTTVDFFRDNGGDRSVNFNIGLTSLDFATRNINVDRYSVLAHKRFRLQSKEIESYILPNTDQTRMVSMYIPLKKQVRYDDQGTGEIPVHQVFCVYWCDKLNTPTSSPVVVDQLAMLQRFVTYFRNTRD